MSSYGWAITVDHLDRRPTHIVGPKGISGEFERALQEGRGVPFQLFDDDHNLYYSGRILGDFEGFEPLDDYGTPHAGCTMMKLDGKWL